MSLVGTGARAIWQQGHGLEGLDTLPTHHRSGVHEVLLPLKDPVVSPAPHRERRDSPFGGAVDAGPARG